VTFITLKWTFVSKLFGQNIFALVLALAFYEYEFLWIGPIV